MRHVPEDLTGFDFLWSKCSLEHLGGLEPGARFVIDSMKCLKPGGVAVHTTGYNVVSESESWDLGHTVTYCRRDIEALVAKLADRGHQVEPVDFDLGDWCLDRYQVIRYHEDYEGGWPVLRVRMDNHAWTSIGLIVTRGG